jgi:uncharacterized membrane protein YhaH (DUF805 family)
MNWGNLLFSFVGRINRGKYWLVMLIWIVASVAVVGATFGIAMTSDGAMIGVIASLLVLVPSAVSAIAIGVKRLHDRNKSGWWILLLYMSPGVIDAVGQEVGSSGAIFSLASFAISVWAIVELGCLRGTDGPNTYGPDPLEAGEEQPA